MYGEPFSQLSQTVYTDNLFTHTHTHTHTQSCLKLRWLLKSTITRRWACSTVYAPFADSPVLNT